MSNYPGVGGDVSLLGNQAWPGEMFCPDEPAKVGAAALHGTFAIDSTTRIDDLRDGSSQTIIVGERLRLPPTTGNDSSGNAPYALYPPGSIGGSTHWPGLSGDCRGVDYVQAVGVTAFPMNVPDNEQPFSSAHRGGAMFVFGDGHVQFINDTIKLDTLKALSTIAGREVISAEELP